MLTPFVHFLTDTDRHQIEQVEDMDEAVQKFRDVAMLTKSKHSTLVAAVEFMIPRFKGHLIENRQQFKGRETVNPTEHTVPMTKSLSILFGSRLALKKLPRLGAAIIVQRATGLRSGELLDLVASDVFVPAELHATVIIRLGVAKREQLCLVSFQEEPEAYDILVALVRSTAPSRRLFPFGYWKYQEAIVALDTELQLFLRLSAHSGRAGFATERIANGESVEKAQAAGRWSSVSSFRIYVDVIGSLHAKAALAAQGYDQEVDRHLTQLPELFSEEVFRLDEYAQAYRQCRPRAPKGRLEVERKQILGAASSSSAVQGGASSMESSGVSKAGTRRGAGEHAKSADGSGAKVGLRASSSKGKGKGRGKLQQAGRRGSIWE